MSKIYLYAEILTHLRQLTLHASLRSEKNAETKVEISSDKKIITVLHDGESSSLYLPTQISGTAKVTFPLDKKTEISARVQIEDVEQWKEADAAGVEAPWNACELSRDSVMKCVSCDSEIMPVNKISTWKDLPNQNWAEVMDLWFCHKPHEHEDGKQEQQAAEAKGFSSQSRLLSQRGTGLVDLISFALHPDDCTNIQITRINNESLMKPHPVFCTNCRSLIGTISPNENLIRLYKSHLSVKASHDAGFVSFPPTTFTCAELLELIETTAIRKVVVYCSETDIEGSGDTTADVTDSLDESKPSQNEITENHAATETEVERESKLEVKHSRHVGPSGSSVDMPTSVPKPYTSNHHSSRDNQQDQTGSDMQPLLLWIFNPDIYYSSSPRLTTSANVQGNSVESNDETDPRASASNHSNPSTTSTSPSQHTPESQPTAKSTAALPHRATKIFYRPLTPTEHDTIFPSPSPTPVDPKVMQGIQHDTLPLPTRRHMESLHKTLKTSTTLLPPSSRTFQDWSIGILDRYERRPTAEKVMRENNPLARGVGSSAAAAGQGEELMEDGRPRVTRWELPRGWRELPRGWRELYM